MIKLIDLLNVLSNKYEKKISISNLSNIKKIFSFCILIFDNEYYDKFIFNESNISFHFDYRYLIDFYLKQKFCYYPKYFNIDILLLNTFEFNNKTEKIHFFLSLCYIFKCNIIINNNNNRNDIYFIEQNYDIKKKTIIFSYDNNNYFLLGYVNNQTDTFINNFVSIYTYEEFIIFIKNYTTYIFDNLILELNTNKNNIILNENEIFFEKYIQLKNKYINFFNKYC